jgi:glycosidase
MGAVGTNGCARSIRRSSIRGSWTSAKWRTAIRRSHHFLRVGENSSTVSIRASLRVFDFPLYYALRDVVIKGASMQKIVDVLRHDELYPHPETLVIFIGNHDKRRFVSEEGSIPAKLKAAFSLLLTLRGIPQIYSGHEIAMPGGDDPDNRRAFPGGFPGDPHNAFTTSGRTAEQQDVFAHVQSLLTLRKNHAALRTGKQWHIGWDEDYYAFVRESSEEKLLVVYKQCFQPGRTQHPRRKYFCLKPRISCRQYLETLPRKS